MKHTAAMKLVDRAYDALDFLNNKTWIAYRNRCALMAEGEERQHRKGAPDGCDAPKVSVPFCGRLFTVMRIAQEMQDASLTVRNLLHCQPSAMYAASIVANYRDEIAKTWAGFDIKQLAELDYCAFLAGEPQKGG